MHKPGDVVFQVMEDSKTSWLRMKEYTIVTISAGEFTAIGYPANLPLFLSLTSPTKADAVRQYREKVMYNLEQAQFTIKFNLERLRKLANLEAQP